MKHRLTEFSVNRNNSPHTQFKRMSDKSMLVTILAFIAALLISTANVQAQQANNGQLRIPPRS